MIGISGPDPPCFPPGSGAGARRPHDHPTYPPLRAANHPPKQYRRNNESSRIAPPPRRRSASTPNGSPDDTESTEAKPDIPSKRRITRQQRDSPERLTICPGAVQRPRAGPGSWRAKRDKGGDPGKRDSTDTDTRDSGTFHRGPSSRQGPWPGSWNARHIRHKRRIPDGRDTDPGQDLVGRPTTGRRARPPSQPGKLTRTAAREP